MIYKQCIHDFDIVQKNAKGQAIYIRSISWLSDWTQIQATIAQWFCSLYLRPQRRKESVFLPPSRLVSQARRSRCTPMRLLHDLGARLTTLTIPSSHLVTSEECWSSRQHYVGVQDLSQIEVRFLDGKGQYLCTEEPQSCGRGNLGVYTLLSEYSTITYKISMSHK